MKKLMFTLVLLAGLNSFAGRYAPISGLCQVGNEVAKLDFPNGYGSLFPTFAKGKISFAVFASPSENLAKDKNGLNLFDIHIDVADKGGKDLGTFIFRHLSASPELQREFSFILRNGIGVNCAF